MKGTIRLGRLAGIPVSVHLSFLILIVGAAALLAVSVLPDLVVASTGAYWLTAGIFVVLFAGTWLAHELAHAALARRFGVRVEGITLWMFGGVTKFGNNPPTPGKAAAIVAVGPAVSCGIAIVSIILARGVGPGWLYGLPMAGLASLAVLNLFLVGLNVLPGVPLDGGWLLQAWLWHRSKDWARAMVTARKTGLAIAVGLMTFGTVTIFFSLDDGLLLSMAALSLVLAMPAEQKRAGAPVRDVPAGQAMVAGPVIAPGWWTVEAFINYLITNGNHDYLFPVRVYRGAVIGTVGRGDLFGIDPNQRATVHVLDIAHHMDIRLPARTGASAPTVPITPLRRTQDNHPS